MQKLRFDFFYPPILGKLIQWFQSSIRTTYSISNVTLKVPRNLDLPNAQKKHKLYDRFLPVLSRHLVGDNVIIDIGANIGDTAVAIAQNCANPILCIEPSTIFYPFLLENINRLPEPQRVKTLQTMIGTGNFSGGLEHSLRGTARLTTTAGKEIAGFTSLDSLVKTLQACILLKSDVDGFDFDVLLSGTGLIERDGPILYWENEIHTQIQIEGFRKLYEMLEKAGYNHLYVFDSFGNLLLEEATFANLLSLNAYLFSIRNCGQTLTFYYMDILASKATHHTIISDAIREYKSMINSEPHS